MFLPLNFKMNTTHFNVNSMVVCVLFALLSLIAHANDGVFYSSGNQLIPWRSNIVSVQKEVLTITLLNNQEAQVDVYYEFYNPGERIEQMVGFEALPPDYFASDNLSEVSSSHPYIHNFSVNVNDQSQPYQTALVVNDSTVQQGDNLKVLDPSRYEADESKSGNYFQLKGAYIGTSITYVYFFTAVFEHGINRVHHTYTYRMGESVYVRYTLDYKLTPALRWANRQIDDFTLRIVAKGNQGFNFFMPTKALTHTLTPYITTEVNGDGKLRRREVKTYGCYGDEKEPVWEFSLRNAMVEIKGKNYKPADELRIEAADYSESGDLCQTDPCRNCAKIVETNTALDNNAKRHLNEAEAGKQFKDKKLQKYFDNLWWYMPVKK